MNVHPYLSFEGRCDEAIEFYKRAVGAQAKTVMRYKDMPGGCPEGSIKAGTENKVMHAELRIGDSTVFVTDGRMTSPAKFAGIMLSLEAADDTQAEKLFHALAEGGTISMPLDKTFFASSFGMLSDRFGVAWLVIAH